MATTRKVDLSISRVSIKQCNIVRISLHSLTENTLRDEILRRMDCSGIDYLASVDSEVEGILKLLLPLVTSNKSYS